MIRLHANFHILNLCRPSPGSRQFDIFAALIENLYELQAYLAQAGLVTSAGCHGPSPRAITLATGGPRPMARSGGL